MKQRLIWAIIATMIVLSGIIPFNFYLSTAFTTPAQKLQAGFYTLAVIESILIFLTSFVVVSEYYRVHPPEMRQLIEAHKEENPEIPDTYYQDPKQRAVELKESGQANRLDKQTIVSGNTTSRTEPDGDKKC